MMLGMQTIIEDYVHSEGAKTFSLALNIFFSFAVGLACVYAVLRLSFV
jgi:succinate dehydrogenase / fumarate reductase membrane anchor subunit